MNPKVVRSVCTWRNRDQWNAVLWCSAHCADQVTVISETGLEADECGRALGSSHILSPGSLGNDYKTPRAQHGKGASIWPLPKSAICDILCHIDKMPRRRRIWSKAVFVQEQFKATVFRLLFWQEGKVTNASSKKTQKSKKKKKQALCIFLLCA